MATNKHTMMDQAQTLTAEDRTEEQMWAGPCVVKELLEFNALKIACNRKKAQDQ